ncbi:MAG: hypothetical protein LBH25_13035 [Fibromonadaceae bacterium]|jgi:hypothetical protein|nr:hypothetical protein [Fibromonadaceae bacterium]
MKKLSLFNEKISQIDDLINAAKYIDALSLINEVLEWAPGQSIGEIPQTGKIYWRKLLANLNCKNNTELLRKGKVLKNNAIFKNAMKYADDNEQLEYALVEKTESLIVTLLEKALVEKELDDKRKTDVEKLLAEYKQKLDAAEKLAQENICQLEEIEKSIHEQVIDCAAVANEYKYALNDMLSAAKGIGDTSRNDILYEEKTVWESGLDMLLVASNAEIQQLEQIKSTHHVFNEYNGLVDKQKNIVCEVDKNILDINSGIRSQIQDLVNSIEDISNKYAKARKSIHNGSYDDAAKLLSQERFDEIIKQAITEMEGR